MYLEGREFVLRSGPLANAESCAERIVRPGRPGTALATAGRSLLDGSAAHDAVAVVKAAVIGIERWKISIIP
jgi:hypothetical protein